MQLSRVKCDSRVQRSLTLLIRDSVSEDCLDPGPAFLLVFLETPTTVRLEVWLPRYFRYFLASPGGPMTAVRHSLGLAITSHQGDCDGSGQQSCKCNYVDFSK